MKAEELAELMKETGLTWDDETADRFERYAALLAEWNEKINLTSIAAKEEVYEKHFADCILPLRRPEIHGSVCDVGSGAGFPGLVFAIAKPSLDVTLMDPIRKRCNFLNEVVAGLGLKNVKVVCCRAEDYAAEARESFDVTTARAVAALPILCELCLPLTAVGGVFLAMKGPGGREELASSAHAIRTLGGGHPEIEEDQLPHGDERLQILIHKDHHSPASYPRPYARIKNRPL